MAVIPPQIYFSYVVNVQYLNQSSQFDKKLASFFITTSTEFVEVWGEKKVFGRLQYLLLITA